MAKQVYETFSCDRVTNAMLTEAAKLFNENYGTWGVHADRPGRPVKLSARRLREQYLPDATASSYTRVTVDGNLAGHAFACRWECDGKNLCWVTQLVVHKDYRERGLATILLRSLRTDVDDIYGIMSSHPAACLAAAKSFGRHIEKIPLGFISTDSDAIMKASPIPYIKDAKLCGTLFKPEDTIGLVSGVNTSFFIDHEAPLEALRSIRETYQWPLGDLPDGHEYLLVLERKHPRSKSVVPNHFANT
ncbi:hypothetical protein BDN72DRAFT_831793 [Pluteus cervinus]|uniref:Uncharacterized protein n=1 Tax=Pluteus cervinus TaxID=181527 RepID=A0ACD3BB18_9AGAR|nr:hypothetical protein BDN72DRAFT_831793 [Pluteus cervinus]